MPPLIFDARDIARGWLSVALASADDAERAVLHRTVSIEAFPDGVRLVATDSLMLFRSWVPTLDSDYMDRGEPGVDVEPRAVAVAMDTHHRAAGLLKHLLKLADAEEAPQIKVKLDLGVSIPDESGATTFEGLEAKYVVVDHPGVERIKLASYDGPYPNWRKVLHGFVPRQTDVIALNGDLLARLGALGKLHGGKPILWQFGGDDHMALLAVASARPPVTGVIMPVRWDFDLDRPVMEAIADDDQQSMDPGSDE